MDSKKIIKKDRSTLFRKWHVFFILAKSEKWHVYQQ